ncbi:MAG: carbohydrate kinase family protein [Oscillospiraceae bacterium]|nr:carbohydrate kinase family protein [Oscillospiraceae bacterium]
MFDIVGIGGSFHDILMLMERFPKENTKNNRLEDVFHQGGGPVATGLCAASRLGSSCSLMTPLGDDDGAEFMKKEYAKDNIDISSSPIRPGTTTHTSYIIVNRDTGNRTICGKGGTVGRLTEADINFDLIKSAKVLMLDGSSGTEVGVAAAKFAREHGVKVMLDSEWPSQGMLEITEHTDFLITSEDCMYEYGESKDIEECLRNAFAKGKHDIVVATLGNKGGAAFDGKDFFLYPIYPAEVVDTNGCGDVFHGAFAFGYTQGWSYNKICHFASGVSSMKCMKLGGRSGIPTLSQLKEWLTPYYDLDAHE